MHERVCWCGFGPASPRIQSRACVWYFMQDIKLLLVSYPLRNMGSIMVKPMPYTWIHEQGLVGLCGSGLFCVVEVFLPSSASIKPGVPVVMSEKADWSVESTHLHHALGTSQVWTTPCFTPFREVYAHQENWGSGNSFRPSRATPFWVWTVVCTPCYLLCKYHKGFPVNKSANLLAVTSVSVCKLCESSHMKHMSSKET